MHKLTSTTPLPNGFSRSQIAMALTPLAQELILFPTEKCNFRCTYCYEDFEIGKMSQATQSAVEKLLINRVVGLKKLNFSWFGGEPLLAKEVVLRLSRFANKLCQENDIQFHGALTTNAYLLDLELAEALLDCNQDFFQITLDGLGEYHDQLRKRADGKGTFDVIWSNLKNMRNLKKNFECVLRIHVRRDNLENLEKLMIEIANEFHHDNRFRIDFQHLRDMGGEGGKTIENPISIEELSSIEHKLRLILKNTMNGIRGISNETESKLGATNINELAQYAGESAGSQRADQINLNQPYICYASKPNSLIVRANGRIGKCTVALNDERNDIGYLNDLGELILNQEKLKPWFRGIETLEPAITGCPIVGLPIIKSQNHMNGKQIISIYPEAIV